ncbi:MAG: hypothetical protein ACLP1Q_12410 [Solirubrobacteraceae bacterium]|jgi:hypothetical protein
MTLLRRAPREVYRVYGEDEFLAYAGRDERFEVAASASGERRLHRIAGATMLLAVTGAVSGLVAITSLSSATGARRRAGNGLLADAGAFAGTRTARADVWRESAVSDDSRRGRAPSQGERLSRGQLVSRTRLVGRAAASRSAATPRHILASEQASATRVVAPVASTQPQPVVPSQTVAQPQPEEPPTVEQGQPAAQAQPAAQSAGQSEFGFER